MITVLIRKYLRRPEYARCYTDRLVAYPAEQRPLRAGVAILLILVTAFAAASVAAEEQDETTLRHLKEVLWPKAYAEQDVALLDSILADEFEMIDADGNAFTKADELAYIKSTRPNYDSLVFRVKRLDLFENGTAIVAGEGTVSGKDDEGPYLFTYQSTNVLIKRNGAWKAIASHVSGVKPDR